MKIVDIENQRSVYERINNLNVMIADGSDAEAVLKYATKFRNEIEQELLTSLLKPNTDVDEAIVYYRVAARFCQKLETDAAIGKRKAEALAKIKQ